MAFHQGVILLEFKMVVSMASQHGVILLEFKMLVSMASHQSVILLESKMVVSMASHQGVILGVQDGGYNSVPSGAAVSWVEFDMAFRDVVHNQHFLTDKQRNQLLLQHLEGEAKRAVNTGYGNHLSG